MSGRPPCTSRTCPVTKPASGEQKNATAAATSSGSPGAAQRDPRDDMVADIGGHAEPAAGVVSGRGHPRGDEPGSDGVDRDPETGPLDRECSRHPDQTRLGRGVVDVAGAAVDPRHRADVDDAPRRRPLAVAKPGGDRADHVEGAAEHDLLNYAPLVVGHLVYERIAGSVRRCSPACGYPRTGPQRRVPTCSQSLGAADVAGQPDRPPAFALNRRRRPSPPLRSRGR